MSIFRNKRPFSKNHSALMPIFCQKYVHSLKITLLSCPYFIKKTSILSKSRCSHVIFSNFSLKTPCCHVHIWSKKRQFCQNYTILWAKKVNRMPFFSDFTRKNQCCHAHILSKKRTFSKKTRCSHSHILSKKLQSSQKHSSLM